MHGFTSAEKVAEFVVGVLEFAEIQALSRMGLNKVPPLSPILLGIEVRSGLCVRGLKHLTELISGCER